MWNNASNFEEEEEEEVEGAINDALLDELDPEDLTGDEELDVEIPLVPVVPVEEVEEEGEDATARAFFEGESEEGRMMLILIMIHSTTKTICRIHDSTPSTSLFS